MNMIEIKEVMRLLQRRPVEYEFGRGRSLGLAALLFIGLALSSFSDDYSAVFTRELITINQSGDSVTSPSIIKAPNGNLLAYFRAVKSGVLEGKMYRSADGGGTWPESFAISYAPYSPSLFTTGGNLYMIFCDGNSVKVARSTNSGETWQSRKTVYTSAYGLESGGAAALTINNGYVYYGFMDTGSGGGWGENYRLVIGSCPATVAAITNAASWTFTTPLAYPSSPAFAGDMPVQGWLEPNCVTGPDGYTWVFARIESSTNGAYAARMRVSANRTTLEWFNRYPAAMGEAGFFYAPWAGRSKFSMAYDATSAKWLVMSTPHLGAVYSDPAYDNARNVLALYESGNMWEFTLVRTMITDDYYEDWDDSAGHTGFQDPAFIMDGTTLRYACRTAYLGYGTYHDANKGTYHELLNFRDYLSPDGEIAKYTFDDPADPGLDSSKMKGSDADLVGPPGYSATGKFGGCLVFDGTNDTLQLMHRVSPKLHRAKQVSVAVWIKNTANNGIIYSSAIAGSSAGLQLMVDPYGKLKISGRSCVADGFQNRSFTYGSIGSWHHVVAIWDFDAGTMRLWLDGTEQTGTGTVAFGSTAGYTREAPAYQDVIGGHYTGTSLFKGAMDDFHIYNRALSEVEIGNLYSGDSSFLFMLYGK